MVLSPHLPFLGASSSVESWKSNVQPSFHHLNSLKGTDSGYFINLGRKSILYKQECQLQSWSPTLLRAVHLRKISIELNKLTDENQNEHLHLFYAEAKHKLFLKKNHETLV